MIRNGTCMVIAALAASLFGSASRGQVIIGSVDPATYWSAYKRASVYVDPDAPDASGGATYRVTLDGKQLWSAHLPFAMLSGGIASDGTVAGYSYSRGIQGYGGKDAERGYGDFRVVVIAPDGRIRMNSATKREASRFLHMSPNPEADGAFMDEENDRFVVRIADPDVNAGNETWKVYSLSTGKPVRSFSPRKLMANPEVATYLIDARPVRGTKLCLLEWWRFGGMSELGARFTLIDEYGKPVWTYELPRDFMIRNNEKAQDKLVYEMQHRSTILETRRPHAFDIRSVASATQLRFVATETQSGGWHVALVAKSPYIAEVSPVKPVVPVPEIASTPNRTIALAVPGSGKPSAIRNIDEFIPAGPGRLALIRDDRSTAPALLLIDQHGKVLREVSLRGVTKPNEYRWQAIAWLGAETFALAVDASGEDRQSQIWIANCATGKLGQIPGFRLPEVKALAALPQGGMVALCTVWTKYTNKYEAYAFDLRGRRRWALLRDFGYSSNEGPEKLFSPEDLTVLSNGRVAIVDNIEKNVKIFTSSGGYVKTIDLKRAWKREPSYPCGIVPDLNGGFGVDDGPSSTPLVRMDGNGNIRSKLTTRYSNGAPFSPIGNVRIAADGTIWATDRDALFRLDATGRAVAALGQPPNPRSLGEIGGMTVDSRGRIYALSSRTGAVNVFDPEGKWLYVCTPKPSEFANEFSPIHSVQVLPDGQVFTDSATPPALVRYAGGGKRLGLQKVNLDLMSGRSTVTANLDGWWHDIRLMNSKWQVVLRLDRRADRKWLGGMPSTSAASDGSLAVLDGGMLRLNPGNAYVTIYTPRGKPVNTFEVAGDSNTVAWNGRLAVVARESSIEGYSSAGQPLWRFVPKSRSARKPFWQPFLAGSWLFLFDGQSTVTRYRLQALPAGGSQ